MNYQIYLHTILMILFFLMMVDQENGMRQMIIEEIISQNDSKH